MPIASPRTRSTQTATCLRCASWSSACRPAIDMIIERLKSGVITVGHGRGFVVEGAGERLVITAAHCLPSLPPALPSFGLEARTYGPLLAHRGEEPRAWAVCRFVDPDRRHRGARFARQSTR